mmetsp:Transcript_14275/g.17966  ORF Transcript_14275/g.17966 Transcript_14275/m.17966 type:complete len:93 (-) Transcript_14275:203-481(-)
MIHGGYQMRRSPFVQRQMAKGKRFDRRRETITAGQHSLVNLDASEVEMIVNKEARAKDVAGRSRTERRPADMNPSHSHRAFSTEPELTGMKL